MAPKNAAGWGLGWAGSPKSCALGAILGACGAILGALGVILGALGRSWVDLGWVLGIPGCSWGALGGLLGGSWVVVGGSWGGVLPNFDTNSVAQKLKPS